MTHTRYALGRRILHVMRSLRRGRGLRCAGGLGGV
jgi:hypothetical protein